MTTPGLLRRLGGLLYEGLTLAALWLLASAVFTSVYGMALAGWPRMLMQGFSLLVMSSYFLWCWTHGGQTLAMRTWRLRVVYANGMPLTLLGAFLRLLVAASGMLAGGVTLWWALLDKDRQFLHDRLAKTRLIDAKTDAGR